MPGDPSQEKQQKNGEQGRLATPDEFRLLVDALQGDRSALEKAAASLEPGPIARFHRLGPALARRAFQQQPPLATPAPWRLAFQQSTARQLLFQRHLLLVGEQLAESRIPWLPIKGLDLCSRVYGSPEDRPAGDIDILVPPDRLAEARTALESSGWKGAFHGHRYESFLADEGYCWLAAQPDGSQLEVHFRFWGMIPEGYPGDLFQRSLEAPSLGASARRAGLEDAYLLAAVHAWMTPPPRPLLHWWDLERIAAKEPQGIGQQVPRLARQWHLELPVALASAQAATLWPDKVHGAIAKQLVSSLRRPERLVFNRAKREGSDSISLPRMTLARLCASRSSRSGWKALGRRLWAHPGIVDRETPERWQWPVRRLVHLGRRVGLPFFTSPP
ncbi:MAG: nucleotidyltransferase family protein [Deltaproteobacteria bacterium]|nr:nucleotidyltransferase family protein [Deltaproteobacteria bacterium]